MHKRDHELERAVQRGDIRGVAQSLRAGASPNASTGVYPVLVAAIFSGETSIARLLLESGANPLLGGPHHYQNPLIAAVDRGDAAIITLLLQKGVDPTRTRPGYATALELAATKGRAEVVACLLAGGVNPLSQDPMGRTALHIAASAGHADVVRILLEAGVPVDVETPQGMTPLAYALHCDPEEELDPILPEARYHVVEVLVSRGADVSHRDASGCSIDDYARERQDAKLLCLLEPPADDTNQRDCDKKGNIVA
ncbi:MAG: hypothetical protein BWK76_06495 [Desulfobulbaceae bacterium A2]|nr:MAG: hypothetical protein BWK76_06495 [Desulfobulbaceae bacterium A2]